jgi:hypothetical protein
MIAIVAKNMPPNQGVNAAVHIYFALPVSRWREF